MGKWKSIKSWNNIYGAQPIIIKIIGQNFWPWQIFLTTIVHSSTQQTLFFSNHGLHLKFNIQGGTKS
jgi:hypothetical protein